jgi:general secretion pathway protein A
MQQDVTHRSETQVDNPRTSYEQHFGFTRPLFRNGIASGDAVFRSEAAQKLRTDLAVAFTRTDSVAIISGPSGTGKSTLATDALKDIDTRLAFSSVSHTPLTPTELLEQLLADFGFDAHQKSRVELLQLWQQFLSEMVATETRVCLLIENADELTPEVLQFLHRLTSADAELSPGANVILTTAQLPECILTTQDLLAFNQRVRLRRRIEALSEAETRDYLTFKCSLAEVRSDETFGSGLAATLHGLSGGIIRVMNNLLESSLITAASNREPILTSERLISVASEQFGLGELAPAAVNELLAESVPEKRASGKATDAIPTLTDFVTLADQDSPDIAGRREASALTLSTAAPSKQH